MGFFVLFFCWVESLYFLQQHRFSSSPSSLHFIPLFYLFSIISPSLLCSHTSFPSFYKPPLCPSPHPHSYFIFILFASFPLLLDFLCLSENLLFTRHRHLPLSRADTPSLRPPFPPSPGLPGRLCLLGECYYSIALHLDNHRLATPNWSEWGRKKEEAAEER